MASLDQDEVLEDDFQTQHMPVCHVRWQGTAAVDPQLGEGLKALEEAQGSGPYTTWTSAKRKRLWKQLTPLGGQHADCSWWSRAFWMRKYPGMSASCC